MFMVTNLSRSSDAQVRSNRQRLGQAEALEGDVERGGIELLLRHAGDDAAVGAFGGAGDEGVNRGDLAALQGEDVEGEALVVAGVGVPAVEGERLLAAGADAERPPAPHARERREGEEGADRLAAAEPAAQRRHREGRLL